MSGVSTSTVQFQVAQFNVYQTWSDSIFPIFFSFYLGAWADLNGRKTIMHIYMAGQFIAQIIILLSAIFMDWPKEVLLASIIIPAAVGKEQPCKWIK